MKKDLLLIPVLLLIAGAIWLVFQHEHVLCGTFMVMAIALNLYRDDE